MARSFGIVEDKIAETNFFLEKLEETTYSLNFFGARFYLSAFLAASRSITFCIKASISDIEGFDKWYASHEKTLKENQFAQFFLIARNESQKVGYYPLNSGKTYKDEEGKLRIEWHFDLWKFDDRENSPDCDALTACKIYFKLLLEIVFDCYQQFGFIMDPDKYYSVDNIERSGKSVEDIEDELGFPREWTAVKYNSEKEEISEKTGRTYIHFGIDDVLIKYLNKNRCGEQVAKEADES